MKTWITAACVAIYVLGATFTFGYAHRESLRYNLAHRQNPSWDPTPLAQFEGLAAALVWPIYWPLHLSRVLWEDKPERK